MPVYMVVEAKVNNRELYQQYLAQVPETVARHGGRYLSRGNRITPLSGDWKPERVILLEFPEEKNVFEWLESPEYRAIAPLREAGAQTRSILLDGGVD